MAEKRLYEPIKYTFKRDEIRELGEALARTSQAVMDLENHRKSAAAGFAAQIKQSQEHMAELTQKINNGYEMREVECLAMLETPRPGMKRIIRLDTNETVREEAMTMNEMQQGFGFTEPEA